MSGSRLLGGGEGFLDSKARMVVEIEVDDRLVARFGDHDPDHPVGVDPVDRLESLDVADVLAGEPPELDLVKGRLELEMATEEVDDVEASLEPGLEPEGDLVGCDAGGNLDLPSVVAVENPPEIQQNRCDEDDDRRRRP